MRSLRPDLSDWLIHFVHDRDPDNDPREWYVDGDPVWIPVGFDRSGEAVLYDDWDNADYEYPLEPDASAFAVLLKILDDGHIRATWSYRNKQPTIYGPYPSVCFTEMPLGALYEYARQRESNAVSTYGIALRREQLFTAGARHVIYGLSGDHREDKTQAFRCLAPECGIGIEEQFRYVATRLSGPRTIDWTHEREWRWPYRCFRDPDQIPGLPVWAQSPQNTFSKRIVIVHTHEEAIRFVDTMREYHDDGGNKYGRPFDTRALLMTSVVAMEDYVRTAKIDDIPLIELPRIKPIAVTKECEERVRHAVAEARRAAARAASDLRSKARRGKDGLMVDAFGYAWVTTYESSTEVTQTLLKLGLAHSIGGLGYRVSAVLHGIDTEGMISVQQAAAGAAADTLTQRLGQDFIVGSRLD